MLTVLSSVSARPNFVKLAAVHRALAARPGDFHHVIVHTGQHYDPLLSGIFFKQLGIPDPDYSLGVKGGTDREAVIQATSAAMMPVMEKVKPDVVLVYGDVNGAVGAARAAKKLGIRIGHVEAGLRSGDLTMPEENNRIEIDSLADELFVTEESAIENIKKEKLKGNIHFVGNTMIDTLIRTLPGIETVEMLPFSLPERFAAATLHRPSNVDDINDLLRILGFFGRVNDILPIVLPMHPRLRQTLERPDPERNTIPILSVSYPIDPLGYIPFLKLMKSAAFILTDSGGIQEEATFLKKRCFTLRRNTERPSTMESGSNVLIDPEKASDRKLVLEFAEKPAKISVSIPPKWDGKAGERIVQEILSAPLRRKPRL